MQVGAGKIPCPCRRDCPDRTADCHPHCQAYLDYEASKAAEYRERAAAADSQQKTAAGYRRELYRPIFRRRFGKRWP